jgi:hypothetical protein
MFMQRLPGGLCFAHGPYTGIECPQWPRCITPRCITDTQQEKWFELSRRQHKRQSLLNAAAQLEECNAFPDMVQRIREEADKWK